MLEVLENIGAGEGNRTLVFSLEGCCSTIELHPRAGDELSRHGDGLNRHAPDQLCKGLCSAVVLRAERPLNRRRFSAYTDVSINTTKGGDSVSYTKRCHLAGIAR
jgi:hypothetical protein